MNVFASSIWQDDKCVSAKYLAWQLIRCVDGTAFVGQIGAKRGKLRNFYYGFTTFEKSNRKMLYKL